MEKSFKRHLVSDVEVGSFLSGGIDSNYLVAGLENMSRMQQIDINNWLPEDI